MRNVSCTKPKGCGPCVDRKGDSCTSYAWRTCIHHKLSDEEREQRARAAELARQAQPAKPLPTEEEHAKRRARIVAEETDRAHERRRLEHREHEKRERAEQEAKRSADREHDRAARIAEDDERITRIALGLEGEPEFPSTITRAAKALLLSELRRRVNQRRAQLEEHARVRAEAEQLQRSEAELRAKVRRALEA